MLFGAPEEIAAKFTLTRKAYELTLRWLRAGEALMRKLVLIEAAALAPAGPSVDLEDCEPRERRQHGDGARREHNPAPLDPSQPTQWRVRFRAMAEGGGGGGPRRERGSRRSSRVRRFFDAAPLARRYEALIRVFNDPQPYAARLARQLHATPERATSLLAHAEDAARLVGPEGFGEVSAAAMTAHHVFGPRPGHDSG
jgi:hypothetical protein